jgi:dTDP-4-amino-4,6-dideoxygalactose transaminase
MPIPLVDLKAQYQSIKQEIDAAIQRVIESTAFILGPDVTEFEREFAAYCQVRFAVGAGSGTAALHLALTACRIGPDDEVIAPAFTFIATVSEILHAGAVPVFCDVDRQSYTIDAAKLAEKIERDYIFNEQVGYLVNRVTMRRLKAIIPVHLYGQMADMQPILDLAKQYNLRVIEDAAQAHGAEYRRGAQTYRAGSLGDIGCFSFYPSKNLGAYGDAGAVVTSDEPLAAKLGILANIGQKDKYTYVYDGFNYRLDTLQAAVLRVKLGHLDEWTDAKRRVAALYNQALAGTEELTLPVEMPYARHVYHLYVVRTERRDELMRTLNEHGIGAAVHYPQPLHLLPLYHRLGYAPGDFPVAEECARTVLSLPIYPELKESEIERIAQVITSSLH